MMCGRTTARTVRRSTTLVLSLVSTLLLTATSGHAQESRRSPLTIWFDEPAPAWNQALPVGNGRLGAMVFGGIERERIQMNEETLWSGGPYDPVVEGAHEALPEIRRHLFDGDFERAHDLFGRTMMGVPYEMMKYQPFADLWLDFPGHEGATGYTRELDLGDAVASVSYVVDGTTYRREVFVQRRRSGSGDPHHRRPSRCGDVLREPARLAKSRALQLRHRLLPDGRDRSRRVARHRQEFRLPGHRGPPAL